MRQSKLETRRFRSVFWQKKPWVKQKKLAISKRRLNLKQRCGVFSQEKEAQGKPSVATLGRLRTMSYAWASGLQTSGTLQLFSLVCALPRKIRKFAAKVTVGSGLTVDRAEEIELLDDRFGPQVEYLAH